MKRSKYYEAEIDQWIENIGPIDQQTVPDGFASKVMALVANEQRLGIGTQFSSNFFWKSIAAGIAVLVALNFYTVFRIKSVIASEGQATSNILNEYQSPDADTYNNYSQLAYEYNN